MGTKLERGMRSGVRGLSEPGTPEYEKIKEEILTANETADEDDALIEFKPREVPSQVVGTAPSEETRKSADFELTEGLTGRELVEKYLAITKRLGELEDGVTEDVLAEADPEVLYAFYVANWLDKSDKGYTPQRPGKDYGYFKAEKWGGPEKSLEQLIRNQMSFRSDSTAPKDDILQEFDSKIMEVGLIGNAWDNISDVVRMSRILEKYFPQLEGKLGRYLERLREFEGLVKQALDFLGLEMVVPKLLASIPQQDRDKYSVDRSWGEHELLAGDSKIMDIIRTHHRNKPDTSPLVSDIKGIGVANRKGGCIIPAYAVVYFPPSS